MSTPLPVPEESIRGRRDAWVRRRSRDATNVPTSPNFMSKMQAYIKEQVDAAMLRNEAKLKHELETRMMVLSDEIDSKIKYEVDVCCKNVFDPQSMDDHFTMVAGEEDEFPLSKPKLERS